MSHATATNGFGAGPDVQVQRGPENGERYL